ncbi:unnamed protein product [Meganyctiphanes norvegica]|uniref:Secreted protein n=1 Tax=Meganyctiphanes norvegica TaxID=48144 RepID=A0AAV2RRT4_MEGNR
MLLKLRFICCCFITLLNAMILSLANSVLFENQLNLMNIDKHQNNAEKQCLYDLVKCTVYAVTTSCMYLSRHAATTEPGTYILLYSTHTKNDFSSFIFVNVYTKLLSHH